MKNPLKVAIVGAGMAGLTCARELTLHGAHVVVFDKGRGLGGRMATRRAEGGFQFDHGAQYLPARSQGFTSMLEKAEAAGAVARWPEDREKPAFVGVPGMTGFAKYLALDLDVRRGIRVERISEAGGHRLLEWEGGDELFERVVITAPAPQIAALLPENPAFTGPLDAVEMDPCLTIMVGFPTALNLPFVTRRAPDEDLSWIACDSAKPGRPDATCIVAQAGREWSRRHLEWEPDRIAELMLTLMSGATGTSWTTDPTYLSAHRWRYAFALAPLGQPYLADKERTLFAGGDWCLGAKAEDAWSSGHAIAEAIASEM